MTNWLLLHGTPLTPAVWDGLRPLLTVEVATPPVAPGAGHATRDQQRAITSRLSADLAGSWHVVGQPFGGQVALELAIQAPD